MTMTLDEFKAWCEEHRDEANAASQAVTTWHDHIPETAWAKGFDMLIETFGAAKTADALIHLYPDVQREFQLGQMIRGANSLKCNPREVHTIGMYYNRQENGGIEHVMANLANAFTEKGYHVILFLEPSADPTSLALDPRVGIVKLTSTGENEPDRLSSRYRTLCENLKKNKVDVLINHAWQSNTIIWDLLAAKLNHIPFIEYVHGTFNSFLVFGEVFWLFDGTIQEAANADAVVCLSEANRSFFRCYNDHVFTVNNPCLLPSAPENLKHRKHSILWVARISPEKQLEEAIRITALVKEKVPDVQLVVVGQAEEYQQEYYHQILQLADELNLGQNIVFEGYQSDVSPYYYSTDILLVTSEQEGFCLVIAEGKLAGQPCVMYDLPGITFCEKPEGLVCVPQKNAELAAKELTRLLLDDGARSQLGQEALKSAEKLGTDAIMQSWENIFTQIAQGFPEEKLSPEMAAERHHQKIMLQSLIDSVSNREKFDPEANKPFVYRYHGPCKKIVTALYWLFKAGPRGVLRIMKGEQL